MKNYMLIGSACVVLSPLGLSNVVAESDEVLLMFHQEGYQPYVPGGGEDPGTPIRLVAGDQHTLPQDVQDDIVAINHAIEATTGAIFRQSIESSPNGRSILVQKGPGQSDEYPEGIWIWPYWRDADEMIDLSGQYEHAKWLSNYHLLLRNDGGSKDFHVIDWRQPEQAYALTTEYRRATVRVADNGRWACETRNNELRVGMLDPDHDDWAESYAAIEIDAPIDQMMFMHAGDILVLQCDPEGAEKEIRIYRIDDLGELQLASSHVGGRVHGHTTLGRHHFFARTWEGEFDVFEFGGDELVVFSIDSSGQISSMVPVDYEHDGRETPTRVSPSWHFTRTQRRNLIGGIVYDMRRTPLAEPDAPIPSGTHGNRPGPPLWISWNE